MSVSISRSCVLAAALAAASIVAVAPASAQESRRGVSITITKQPSYLNTRSVPSSPASVAKDETTATTQPFYNQQNSVSFSRGPLPSTFSIPGY